VVEVKGVYIIPLH